jgi:hypothetical protein
MGSRLDLDLFLDCFAAFGKWLLPGFGVWNARAQHRSNRPGRTSSSAVRAASGRRLGGGDRGDCRRSILGATAFCHKVATGLADESRLFGRSFWEDA